MFAKASGNEFKLANYPFSIKEINPRKEEICNVDQGEDARNLKDYKLNHSLGKLSSWKE